jgi:hypothetical protein
MAATNSNSNSVNKIFPSSINHSDRVAWRFPTSDVIGSHLRDDLDSYLALVRRKIQEKYGTTRDLIIGEVINAPQNRFCPYFGQRIRIACILLSYFDLLSVSQLKGSIHGFIVLRVLTADCACSDIHSDQIKCSKMK